LRGGRWQYRLIRQFMERIPIPRDLKPADSDAIARLARNCNELGPECYRLESEVLKGEVDPIVWTIFGSEEATPTGWVEARHTRKGGAVGGASVASEADGPTLAAHRGPESCSFEFGRELVDTCLCSSIQPFTSLTDLWIKIEATFLPVAIHATRAIHPATRSSFDTPHTIGSTLFAAACW
jgi:hypothetical protein